MIEYHDFIPNTIDYYDLIPKLKDIITKADQPNKLKKEKMKKQINQSLTWYDGLREHGRMSPASASRRERWNQKLLHMIIEEQYN